MVLLAAAVCTKGGKAIISRQFVEMSRSRIEGLVGAFPKLMSTSSSEKQQHTFVETDSVRYVYQPLDRLYMVLITTKASNILEDLETLRLFSKVIPEYCRSVEEAEVASHAFDLLFAFDEIVALGYRESVNLAQIRTFTEMDSHEEKVFLAIRQSQEREAKQKMREKAKELQRAQADAGKRGKPTSTSFGSSSFGNMNTRDSPVADTVIPAEEKPKPAPQRATGKALVLGPKNKDADKFVDQLKSEGQNVISPSAPKTISAVPSNTEKVRLIMEEKLTVSCGRDGDLRNLEVLGMIMLHVTDEQFGRIKITLVKDDPRDIGLQTHPNVDKKLFMDSSIIALKNPSKPFPMNSDVGVLKWRFQTTDVKQIPLSITCWPSFSSSGCDVNLEFELMQQHLVLNDVAISIPLPSGGGAPVVTECGIGDYIHEAKKHNLVWSIPVIDADNSSGGMEFSMPNVSANTTGFFPVNVSFSSSTITCGIKVTDVKMYDTDVSVRHSFDSRLVATTYEVI